MTEIDVEAARDAVIAWLAAEGCGCCSDGDALEAAQRKVAEALGLVYEEPVIGDAIIRRP